MKLFYRLLMFGRRITAAADRVAAAALAAVFGNDPVTYSLPGAPPTGRRVRDALDRIFIREAVPSADGYRYAQWGSWLELRPGSELRYPWSTLLAYGPLTLLPYTDEQEAQMELYGPPEGRWGDPDTPCPYVGCALGTGHVGVHRDAGGAALGVTREARDAETITAAVTRDDFETMCTCGHPAQHRQGCARYGRTTGK